MAETSGSVQRASLIGLETFVQGQPYGVVKSIEGETPGPDFTYTVVIQTDEGPTEFTGYQPPRRDGFDYEPVPVGQWFNVVRTASYFKIFLHEDIAVQECPSG